MHFGVSSYYTNEAIATEAETKVESQSIAKPDSAKVSRAETVLGKTSAEWKGSHPEVVQYAENLKTKQVIYDRAFDAALKEARAHHKFPLTWATDLMLAGSGILMGRKGMKQIGAANKIFRQTSGDNR
jgi:hypothetical protein